MIITVILKILLIIFLVIFAVIALIALILSINIRVIIKYDGEGLYARYNYLFYRKQIYPEPFPKDELSIEELKKMKKKLLKQSKPSKGEGQKTKKKKVAKKKPFEDILSLIKEVVYLLYYFLDKGLSYAKINIKKLDIVVATGDAAKTALTHTAVCQVLNALIERIEATEWDFRFGDMECRCDYLKESFSCNADIVIKIRLWHLLHAWLYSLTKYFNKININGGSTNGKQD